MNRIISGIIVCSLLLAGCGGTVLAEDKRRHDCIMDLSVCPQHTDAPKGSEVYKMEQCSIPYACPVDDPSELDGWVCVRYVMVDCFERNP